MITSYLRNHTPKLVLDIEPFSRVYRRVTFSDGPEKPFEIRFCINVACFTKTPIRPYPNENTLPQIKEWDRQNILSSAAKALPRV